MPRSTVLKGSLSSLPKIGTSLDPSLLDAIGPYHLMHNLGVTLLKMRRTGEITPWAASEFLRISAREFVLSLRPDLKFSDGRPITVNDVVRTFYRSWKRGSVHVPLRKWIGDNEQEFAQSIRAESSGSIRVLLKHPVVNFDYYLQMADLVVLTPEQQVVVDRNLTPADWRVSSGPYRIQESVGTELGYNLVKNNSCTVCETGRADIVELTNQAEFDFTNRLHEVANFGVLPFGQYFRMLSSSSPVDPDRFRISGSRSGFIITLVLNSSKAQWRNSENRVWVRRALHSRIVVATQYTDFIKPAYMYMLPHAPSVGAGDIESFSAMARADAARLGDLPVGLKNRRIRVLLGPGVRIRSPDNIEEMLRQALTPLELDFYWVKDQNELERVLSERDFDTRLMAASNSYRSASESFNLAYLSRTPIALDPTGKIKKLVAELQSSETVTSSNDLVFRVLRQIHSDSEIVPLVYSGNYKWVDPTVIDDSSVSWQESMHFSDFKVN